MVKFGKDNGPGKRNAASSPVGECAQCLPPIRDLSQTEPEQPRLRGLEGVPVLFALKVVLATIFILLKLRR